MLVLQSDTKVVSDLLTTNWLIHTAEVNSCPTWNNKPINSQLVSWYFEPSQPQRMISGLKASFNLSPSYCAHKSSSHKFSRVYKISPGTNHIKQNIDTQTSNTKIVFEEIVPSVLPLYKKHVRLWHRMVDKSFLTWNVRSLNSQNSGDVWPQTTNWSTYRMVVKSSSTRIMSAASLETSVPERPMEMPISALFNATASFTPSPVIPTTTPFCCKACEHTPTVGQMYTPRHYTHGTMVTEDMEHWSSQTWNTGQYRH